MGRRVLSMKSVVVRDVEELNRLGLNVLGYDKVDVIPTMTGECIVKWTFQRVKELKGAKLTPFHSVINIFPNFRGDATSPVVDVVNVIVKEYSGGRVIQEWNFGDFLGVKVIRVDALAGFWIRHFKPKVLGSDTGEVTIEAEVTGDVIEVVQIAE